jgi:hypothetical protein
MGQTQCRRCGGQISTNSTACPWCGHATTFNVVGPLLLVVLLGAGIAFALGLLRWEWLEQSLGLDRGFVDQVVAADAAAASASAGADLGWRLPPGPDPAENHAVTIRRNRSPILLEPVRPQAPPARVAEVVRARQSVPPSPGGPGCADSSAVGRLVSRYPLWSNSDLALISCGHIRSGFSADQVHASLGKPTQITKAGPGREQWRYSGVSLIVEQGRVISYGQ